jgi:hypothetical protein
MAALAGKQHHNFKHGMYRTPTWKSWNMMIQRTTNPIATGYERYGGKGVKVCEEWRDFRNFLRDMGVRPEGTSIDRIDGSGDYTPENCKWSTRKQQTANSSVPRWITFNGITLCMSDWAKKLCISLNTLSNRLNAYGWSIERALTERVKCRGKEVVVGIAQRYHRVTTRYTLFHSTGLRRIVLKLAI